MIPPEIASAAVALLGLGLVVFIAFWRAEQEQRERLEADLALLRADHEALRRALDERRPAYPRMPARVYGEALRRMRPR